MLRVYLDQNQWIYLTRGRLGLDARLAKAFASLLNAANSGDATFHLSASHYMETGRRGRLASRQQLAVTMFALAQPRPHTRPMTIASPPEITPTEIDKALQRRFGRPTEARKYEVFGAGFGHAFGRPPFPIASEFELLAGNSDGSASGYTQFSDRFSAAEERLKGIFSVSDFTKAARDGQLAVRSMHDLLEPMTEALERANLGAECVPDSIDEMIDFLRELPTRWVDYRLHTLRFDNPQMKRGQGDLVDFAALSVAVVHCDVVVTERQWVDLLTREGFAAAHATAMLSRVDELAQFLESQ